MIQGRRLWAVQGFGDQITRVQVSPNLSSGVVEKGHHQLVVPVALNRGLHGSRLAVVNAKFDTGIPPTADQHEVVLVKLCRA